MPSSQQGWLYSSQQGSDLNKTGHCLQQTEMLSFMMKCWILSWNGYPTSIVQLTPSCVGSQQNWPNGSVKIFQKSYEYLLKTRTSGLLQN